MRKIDEIKNKLLKEMKEAIEKKQFSKAEQIASILLKISNIV